MWLVKKEGLKLVDVFFGGKPTRDTVEGRDYWLGDSGRVADFNLHNCYVKELIGREITAEEGPVRVEVTEIK